MPRGRKETPQESIDSILLAISRRNNIDADTMSHYFDRLDEKWTEGVREKVLHLLRSADPSAHTAAMLILSELATDFDLETLEDFVADPTISDMAKLSLSPILKELGSEMTDDGIIEYLNDPLAAIQQMQTRLLDLVGQNEVGIEAILEDVLSMPTDQRLAFINWLGSSNDPRAAHLLIPLLENQSGKNASTVIEALEQLGPIAVQQTIPALNYCIASSSNRELKQHARAVLGRLTMQSMLGVEDDAFSDPHSPQLPVYEARTSFIDGSGSQLILLSWQRPDGILKGVNILYQDQWGIKECYGVDEMDKAGWQRLVGELDEQSFSSFLVPIEYARALISEARTLNKRTRHKLPIAYSIWRSLIQTDQSVKKRTKPVSTSLALPPLNADTLVLAQQGDTLYQMSEFLSWLYEPSARIEPYMIRYWSSQNLFASTSGKQARKRKGKQQEGEQQALLDELINEALPELVDAKWRTRYELRLRRQAALLQFADRTQDAILICAVAAMLHPDSQIPLQEQSFLQAMMRASIKQGPLRMMVESLDMDHLAPLPIKLFSDER